MRKVFIIGMGAGNPDYVTIQAVKALNAVDVFFIPDKGRDKRGLRELRTTICERFIEKKDFRIVDFAMAKRGHASPDYQENVKAWHAALEEQYSGLLMNELADGQCGAFLVWGDPTLYDSTLRIIDSIRATNRFDIDYEIIPGISSVQALAAQHRIALNRIGQSVHITTGRKLAEGFPNNLDSMVVLLDGEQAFKKTGRGDLDIYWGAYLGTEDEILVSGRLSEVMDDIERIREEERQKNGWIMDTYLLRTPETE